jgi:hypothetical protein
MSDSKYSLVYTGHFLIVQQMVNALIEINISPIVKDETESGRLAGFGTALSGTGTQELYVHKDELAKATTIITTVKKHFR